jgi:hypothetical protein
VLRLTVVLDRRPVAAIEHLTAHRTNQDVFNRAIGVDAVAELLDRRRGLASVHQEPRALPLWWFPQRILGVAAASS